MKFPGPAWVLAVFLCAVAMGSEPAESPAVLPGKAAPSGERIAELRRELIQRVESGELQSLAIGVIQDGNIEWAEAWGWADREKGIHATVDTPYGIASMGKVITAETVMTLVAEGLLDLDMPVDAVLGSERLVNEAGGSSPTIRQLLNMTAGVPHGALTYTDSAAVDEGRIKRDQYVVAFPPGSTFHYSNFSIAVLEDVVEQVSGQPFGVVVEQRLFAPLGMDHSAVDLDSARSTTAARYREKGERVSHFNPFPRSSRQMTASLNDLLRFAAFNLDTPLPGQRPPLPADALQELQTQRSDIAGAHIALAWGSIDLSDAQRWILSSGNDWGAQSHLTVLREEKLGVVVLTNSSGYQADEIAIQIVDAYVPGFGVRARAAIMEFEGRTHAYEPAIEWTGTWRGFVRSAAGDLPLTLKFQPEGIVLIKLAGEDAQVVQEPMVRDFLFTGFFHGRLPLEEAAAEPHRVELGLKLDGDALNGFVLANFSNARGKFELPTIAHLQRCE